MFSVVPVTLLSSAGLVSTALGQVDIPLEDVGNDSGNDTASERTHQIQEQNK
jgi:hypothetical protein